MSGRGTGHISSAITGAVSVDKDTCDSSLWGRWNPLGLSAPFSVSSGLMYIPIWKTVHTVLDTAVGALCNIQFDYLGNSQHMQGLIYIIKN